MISLDEAIARLIVDEVAHSKRFDDVAPGMIIRSASGQLYRCVTVLTESGVPLVKRVGIEEPAVLLVFDYTIEKN